MTGSPLARIVRTLGGELYAGGRRANLPAPGHSAEDRSVSLLLDGRRVVVHSFGAADWRDVLDDLRARGLIDAEGRVCGAGGALRRETLLSPSARVARALTLWAQARPLGGTLSARHLARRAVQFVDSSALRHHPALPLRAYAGDGGGWPALLALIRDAEGAPCGVEATYLAPSGDRARLRTPRKTLGRRPAGAAVRLHAAAAEMVVGEGVFTTLSASEAFGLPGWALLAAENLRRWAPPPGVRRVLVAGDRGAAGETAAQALVARPTGLGLRADLRLPPMGLGDWNDWAVARRNPPTLKSR